MKYFDFVVLTAFLMSSMANAGAAFQVFRSESRPDVEICKDKTGTFITVQGKAMEKMTSLSLDNQLSEDGKFRVERLYGPHPPALFLIEDEVRFHVLDVVGGGFGNCGESV